MRIEGELEKIICEIDEVFGDGFADDHPALVGSEAFKGPHSIENEQQVKLNGAIQTVKQIHAAHIAYLDFQDQVMRIDLELERMKEDAVKIVSDLYNA